MELYIDKLNAAGGVNGRRIVMRRLDDDNKAATAEANARPLVQGGAFLLFGPIEGGPPTLRRPLRPMVFPVRAEHREEFRALMSWGRSTGLKKVGFFHADSDGCRQHLQNLRLIAQELGLEVVQPLPVKSDAKPEDFDAMVALMQASQPDMVFAQGVPSPWERKREIAREYQDAVRKARPDAEFSHGALEGCMTAQALALALKAAGRDLSRAGLIKGLESTSFDLGGVKMRHTPTEHEGSNFVDLAMVTREGKFIH